MIRAATKEDIAAIMPLAHDFHTSVGSGHGAWRPDKAQEFVEWAAINDKGLCLVHCDDDGKIDGYLTAIVGPMLWDPDYIVCVETTMWVAEDSRGKGAASGLIAAMVDHARESKCKAVTLCATNRNSPDVAAAIYKKRGFELLESQYSMEF